MSLLGSAWRRDRMTRIVMFLLASYLAAGIEAACQAASPRGSSPQINGPRVYGVRPGTPFVYAISATGERPMEFSAEGLPEGLKVDAKVGRRDG
jgi:alpha-galactosidase